MGLKNVYFDSWDEYVAFVDEQNKIVDHFGKQIEGQTEEIKLEHPAVMNQ